MYRAGIDIGGTKVIIGFMDENGKLLYQKKQIIPENAKEDGFLQWLLDALDETTSEAGVASSQIDFCGIGVPGTVSRDKRTVIKAPNLNWENKALAAEFTAATGIQADLVQDSRAGAWGEYTAGAGRGYQNVVCITLGTGIGTGVVLNGEIFQGSLGCAGELGHIPVKGEGRECGCGQVDCLEKYAAGLGLDVTARKLFGESSDARDLFDRGRAGDTEARKAINQAVRMLGRVLVSVVNFLSPDCLLFSGGLSAERELYVEPLIRYIKEHCYGLAGEQIQIGLAELGELAPMMGCALLPHRSRRHASKISASIMCADWMNMGGALRELEENGIDLVHCDIMDNHFVPNMMLPPDMLRKMGKTTRLPLDIHIMAENPEAVIGQLELRPGDYCSVHYESTKQLQRALALVREKGANAAVAINPGTAVEALREVLPDIDMVLVMTVNPGFAGQKLVPQTLEKISRVRSYLDEQGYPEIRIEVDGNCSFENLPKMLERGADIFVVGSSSVFDAKLTVKDAVERIHDIFQNNSIH